MALLSGWCGGVRVDGSCCMNEGVVAGEQKGMRGCVCVWVMRSPPAAYSLSEKWPGYTLLASVATNASMFDAAAIPLIN